MQRGFHIIFAVAAVDSVRRNFCSSYLSLEERETVVPADWIKEEQKMFARARAYVCVSKETSFPPGKYFRYLPFVR